MTDWSGAVPDRAGAVPDWRDGVRSVLADAGADGWLHAAVVGRPDECIGAGSDVPVVLASMYKLYVMVAVCRSADAGRLDPLARVTVDPARHAPGPTGLGAFADNVELSVRDLVLLMMTVSDNTAAEVLRGLLPAGAFDEALAVLGTGLEDGSGASGGEGALHERARRWGGTDYEDAAHHLAHDPAADAVHAGDPAYVTRATPRALCTAMAAVWKDTAASPESCRFMRGVLGRQVWTHRIASGFPQETFRVFGKTGTIGRIRAETAVVEPDGETPIVVCVVTRAARAEANLPRVDASVGAVARIAVDHLRMSAFQRR
ncbi:serine hydrolase [Tomitella fengzijianii]|uniref:Serine hydrolase n=1 Tax=Tomitella fengzijianii TaxID=2597660 RepID=A0A516X6S7_9ACTN|nr:serine hydrolase [Tomitella fengzijianii]QDQ98765.1 serine hydrolase [Tomitella fengzijianii]